MPNAERSRGQPSQGAGRHIYDQQELSPNPPGRRPTPDERALNPSTVPAPPRPKPDPGPGPNGDRKYSQSPQISSRAAVEP